MRCGVTCLIASVLTISAFACLLPMHVKETDSLRALLDKEQLEILDKVVYERSRLAFEGLLLGTVVALPLGLFFSAWCCAAISLFITQSIYYNASPKTYWLLDHLNSREQVQQWLRVYRTFKLNGIVSSLGAAFVYLVTSLFSRTLAQVKIAKEAKAKRAAEKTQNEVPKNVDSYNRLHELLNFQG